MCLSTVYKDNNGTREKLGEYISSLKVADGKIIICDIMGAEKEIKGKIQNIDLVKNEILLAGDN